MASEEERKVEIAVDVFHKLKYQAMTVTRLASSLAHYDLSHTSHMTRLIMNELMPITYSEKYVLSSYLISALGCFVGLIASQRIITPQGKISKTNAISAGVGLGGVGVWSMHFMGMLAVNFELAKGYSLIETLASLLVAIVVTTLCLVYAVTHRKSFKKLLRAGLGLGLGISVMHYLGMYGLRFRGYFQWDYVLVALSVVVAIVAATAALYLITRAKRDRQRLGAALVMGAAICAMHYTGMFATSIICTTPSVGVPPQGFAVVSAAHLPLLLLLTTTGFLLVISADQLSQSFYKAQASSAKAQRSSKPRAQPAADAHPAASTEPSTSPR